MEKTLKCQWWLHGVWCVPSATHVPRTHRRIQFLESVCLTVFFETSSLTMVWLPEQQHIFQDALTVRNDVTLYPRKSFCNWLYFSVCGSSIYTSKFVAHLTFTSPPRLLGNYHISILLRTPGSLFVSSLCFAPAPSFVSSFFVAEVIKLATIAGSKAPYI